MTNILELPEDILSKITYYVELEDRTYKKELYKAFLKFYRSDTSNLMFKKQCLDKARENIRYILKSFNQEYYEKHLEHAQVKAYNKVNPHTYTYKELYEITDELLYKEILSWYNSDGFDINRIPVNIDCLIHHIIFENLILRGVSREKINKRYYGEKDVINKMWDRVNTRIYLNVPFRDKDYAKRLGAKWDADKKKWYAPNDSYTTLIEKYS